MDELCNSMENLIPVHDPPEEYRILKLSRTIPLADLSKDSFLQQSFGRYRKYLKYINFMQFSQYDGELIIFLINDFLQYEHTDHPRMFLAAKCVVIDTYILDYLETVPEISSEGTNDYDF